MTRFILILLLIVCCTSSSWAQDTAPGESQQNPSEINTADQQSPDKSDSTGTQPYQCNYDKIKKEEPKLSIENLLYRSIEEPCANLMADALKKESAQDIYLATKVFTEKVFKNFSDFYRENKGKFLDPEETKALQQRQQEKVKSITLIRDFLQEKCPKKDVTSDACKAMQTYASFAKDFIKLANQAEADGKKEQAAYDKEALKNDPEHRFKLNWCKSPNLYEVIFVFPITENGRQRPIESNCIYGINGQNGRFYVIQSADGGILVGQPNSMLADKIIFIKTKKKYADGDIIQDQYVRSTGLKKYRNALGQQKTINSFQYLGDIGPS